MFSETSECPVPGYDRDITESFQHLKIIGSILVALSGPILLLPERSLFFWGGGGKGRALAYVPSSGWYSSLYYKIGAAIDTRR